MDSKNVGILGATSLVGTCLIQQFIQDQWQINAYSRKPTQAKLPQVIWHLLNHTDTPKNNIALWVCAAPIWTLPQHFQLLLDSGAERIVVLSSTSRFSKIKSPDSNEQIVAQQLITAENEVTSWANKNSIEWVILRPTLIYGLKRDKNITEMIRFILRYQFFPLLGHADGLRQPIHAKDVALACILALKALNLRNCTYNLTGGETLTYRDMVKRIFWALDKKPRLITIPLWLFQLAIAILRLLPRYRHWTTAMAKRMNQDLKFDSTKIQHDLQFTPKPFILSTEDLPTHKSP